MAPLTELLDRARAWRPSPDHKLKKPDPLAPYEEYTDRETGIPIKPEDILTPEEVAARLKVPESWVYEKTRSRCRNPMPCLRLGRFIRFDWNAVVSWLTAGAEQETHATRPKLPRRR